MHDLILVIGDKNLSSWSLRPWVMLRHASIPFKEELVPLDRPETHQNILRWSPSGKVPALIHGGLVVHDSLAIIEYAAELFPEKNIWPAAREDRARARSVSAEMHSGFATMRQELPMNLSLKKAWGTPSPALARDIARVQAIWRECLLRSNGPFLFGEFCAVDAMYAPVVTRFLSYSVPVEDKLVEDYLKTVRNLPAMQDWYSKI
jgi:glutathione S-transferase